MSLSFGLKVRTVVKPSHVVRDLGDLLSRPRRHADKAPSLRSPPRRLLPTRCRQAQLELGLSVRYGSSRMTPMQHTLKITALPKLSALPSLSHGGANSTWSVYRTRHAKCPPQSGAMRDPSNDHKLVPSRYGPQKVPRLPLRDWYRR